MTTLLKKSLTEDATDVFRAIALIELGARMQVLESELPLSRDRMIRLYREVKGVSPPKGMLPFSGVESGEAGTSRLSAINLANVLGLQQQDLATIAGVHPNTLRMH